MLNMLLSLVISIPAAILVMWVHEISKYYISLTLLHPIHRKRMDIKINPVKYIDPIGLIMFVFSGVGWQKPGEYNAALFKDKERAYFPLMLTGMIANLLLIIVLVPVYLLISNTNDFILNIGVMFLFQVIRFSFSIIIINLLPVPPLDMSKIIHAFNPSFYFKLIQNERMIQAVFILLVATNIITLFVSSLFTPLFQLL